MIVRNSYISWFRVRGNILGPAVFFILMFSIEGAFWHQVSAGGALSLYGTNELLLYVFAALTTSQIVAVSGEPDQLASRIESGNLETYLVRPTSVIFQLSRIQCGIVLARLTLFLPLLLALNLILLKTVHFSGILIYFGMVFLAAQLNFLINFSLSCLTFWYRESYAFVVFKETLWWMLSGALIPLDLFPSALKNIFEFLPSSYVVFYPVKLLMESAHHPLRILAATAVWTVVMMGVSVWMWNKGVRKYQAYGS